MISEGTYLPPTNKSTGQSTIRNYVTYQVNRASIDSTRKQL